MSRVSSHDHLNPIVEKFPLVKLSLFLLMIYFNGFIYGTAFSFILRFIYKKLLRYFLNLSPLDIGDYCFIYINREDIFTSCAELRFNDFNKKAFIQRFKEKGMRFFEKLRSVRTVKFYEFWWKVLPYEEAVKYLVIEERPKIINSREDFEKEMDKEMNIPVKADDALPYKLIIYDNDKSKYGKVVLFKYDHSFTDGLGFESLMLFLADNYSEKLFPFNKPYSWTKYIINILSLPFNLIRLFYIMITTKVSNLPTRLPE